MIPTLCRYPGGKAKLARPILAHLNENIVTEYREPFFGGGAIGLRMMLATNATCWFNDLDPIIHALWHAVAHYPNELKAAVCDFTPTVEEFRRIKTTFNSDSALISCDAIAVARDKLALQSMSYGGLGVMAHGPMGGWSQVNPTVGSRWLPESICGRIDLISGDLARARITNLDFADMLSDDGHATIYLDPPYFSAGPGLYQHAFDAADHLRLRELLRHTAHDWLLSYDDCPWVRDLYSFAHIEEVKVTYSVSKSRRTHELLISPRRRNQTFLAMAA